MVFIMTSWYILYMYTNIFWALQTSCLGKSGWAALRQYCRMGVQGCAHDMPGVSPQVYGLLPNGLSTARVSTDMIELMTKTRLATRSCPSQVFIFGGPLMSPANGSKSHDPTALAWANRIILTLQNGWPTTSKIMGSGCSAWQRSLIWEQTRKWIQAHAFPSPSLVDLLL